MFNEQEASWDLLLKFPPIFSNWDSSSAKWTGTKSNSSYRKAILCVSLLANSLSYFRAARPLNFQVRTPTLFSASSQLRHLRLYGEITFFFFFDQERNAPFRRIDVRENRSSSAAVIANVTRVEIDRHHALLVEQAAEYCQCIAVFPKFPALGSKIQ